MYKDKLTKLPLLQFTDDLVKKILNSDENDKKTEIGTQYLNDFQVAFEYL